MNPLITVTKRAVERIAYLLKGKEARNVLFYVQGGGCNGMKYMLEPVHRPDPKDEVIPLKGDAKLVVCHKSLMFLIGTEIDVEDNFMGEAFSFQNPNVSGTCGCGQTFTPQQ